MLRMGEIMQRIEATGLVDDDARVVAAGGPLENVPLWGRMVSDVLGKTVELTDAVEVTSRGVACLLCESLSGSPALVPVLLAKDRHQRFQERRFA